METGMGFRLCKGLHTHRRKQLVVVKWERASRGIRNYKGLEVGRCGDRELGTGCWNKCHLPSHQELLEKTNVI